MKRRILEELQIDEISGVDRPCQEHALVTIMKRATEPPEDVANGTKKPPMEFEQAAPVANKTIAPAMEFEQAVAVIRKRDNCSRTSALSKARLENPGSFTVYRETEDGGTDFDKLVQAEVDSGAPLAVAGQRVLQKYGARAMAPRIEKGRTTANDFMALVNSMMGEHKLSRTAALREARKRNPKLFEAYQAA